MVRQNVDPKTVNVATELSIMYAVFPELVRCRLPTPISVFSLMLVLKASPLADFVPVRNYASMLFISYKKCTCSLARSAKDFLITSIATSFHSQSGTS